MSNPKDQRNLILFIVAGLLLLGGGSLLLHRGPVGAGGSVFSLVNDNKKLVTRFALAAGREHRFIDVKGPLGMTRVEVDGDQARVVSSPCRDKICIKFGWLRKAGDFSACLPNRVLVTVDDPRR